MQVLDATVCQLSNFEAYTVLEDWRKNRRAQEILPSGSVFELEKRLLKSDSMRGERLLSRDQVEGFLAALDELCTQYTAGVDGETFYLSVAEKIQILNLKPTSVVLLENIVEGLASEERLCAADVESFGSAVIGLVQSYLITNKRKEQVDSEVYCTDSEAEEDESRVDVSMLLEEEDAGITG